MAALGKRKRQSELFTDSQSQTSRSRTLNNTQDEQQGDGDGSGRGFVEGSIVRITMQNFLSYNYSEVIPGPNLNMIVGPNGTGKSSIVCAICLGLAGKTTVLGRGDKVGLYVKRGCTKGSVEIELHRVGGNLVIQREIYVENNQSVWTLNGRHVSQKAVEEEVKALHIQVGNLCQFLPQNVCKEKASFLEKVTQRNERNKQDVERYYEKKRHLDMIKMLDSKRPWVEYETARREFEDVKSEREKAKTHLKTLKEAQTPILRKIQLIDNQLRPIENKMKDKAAAIREASQKCKQKQDQLDRKNKEVEDIQQVYSLKQTEEVDRQKRISNTRRLIEGLKAELSTLGPQEDVTPQINGINAELRKTQEERAQIDGEQSDLRREKDTQTGELNRKVYEPMMLVINVKDARHAKYIESHLPQNDLKAFVFEKQEDMEVFMTEVRDNQRLRVNAVIAPAESCAERPPSRPIQALQRFGFFSYLRELFDAPAEVMSYLCHQHRVNEIPVGNEKTKSMIETVIRESNLRIFFTAEEKYTVKKSSYSNRTISSNSALRPPQFLSMTMDTDEKRHLEENVKVTEQRLQSINAQMKALQERKGLLDRRDNELRAQKKQLSELKGKKRQLEQKISTKKDSLRQMEESGIDLQKEEQETKAKIRAVNSQKVSIIAEFTHHMKLRARLQMDKVYFALESVQLAAEKTKLEAESREGGAQLRELEAFSQLPNTLDEIDARLNEERSRVECFTGISAAVVEEYTKRTQEIEHLTRELEEKKNALDTYRQNISQAKENWLNPLKQLVEKINEKFSDFFRSMQCAGEVDLHSENEARTTPIPATPPSYSRAPRGYENSFRIL
ncbi:hypothetical protein JZ751_012167 [Albula glossodonta]|uniref:Structural maintenance of chromosomes protein 5 n=1 Tax=Albula glossodonta TaxID=121402 RepID=A0A8T2PRR0_9TELE|nr:hypothetical protein JZ751_012167 [Albula glossodonta]